MSSFRTEIPKFMAEGHRSDFKEFSDNLASFNGIYNEYAELLDAWGYPLPPPHEDLAAVNLAAGSSLFNTSVPRSESSAEQHIALLATVRRDAAASSGKPTCFNCGKRGTRRSFTSARWRRGPRRSCTAFKQGGIAAVLNFEEGRPVT